jgi:hypothetical protein
MRRCGFFLLFLLGFLPLYGDNLRLNIAGDLEISVENTGGSSISFSHNDAVIIRLDEEVRFFRGVELELTAPQTYLAHRGSLVVVIYGELDQIPETGAADIQGRPFVSEPMPNKIQTIYQFPLRVNHGLRSNPYVSIPVELIPPSAFPIIFKLNPAANKLSEEVETMRFRLNVKPIMSDEGGVRIHPRYPEQLPNRPLAVYIDNELIDKPQEERLLREGEHHLMILSNDYRTESRRFLVERGKIGDLTIELRDATPLVLFEAPENSRIYFDGVQLEDFRRPYPAEPGVHEVKFQVSDYAIAKSIKLQKGRTYRIALTVDLNFEESE